MTIVRRYSPFERHFVYLFVLLLFVGLVTSTDEVLQLFNGIIQKSTQVTSVLRFLREGVYVVLLADFVLYLVAMRDAALISRGAMLFSSLVILWAAICACYSVALDLPLPAIIAGMRFMEYLPLALIVNRVWSDVRDRPFFQLGTAIFIFMFLESILGAFETRLRTPFWGVTFIGSRAFGTFTSPNIFGPTMVMCFLYIRATLSKSWQLWATPIAVFDVLASGSRAAVLGLGVVFAIAWLLRIRDSISKSIVVVGGLFSVPLIFRLVSSSAITGRATDIGQGGLERLGVWSRTLEKLDTSLNFLMGWGTGLGSNTVFSIYGDLPGAYISDNTFFFLVGSFGIVGVLLFTAALAACAWRLRNDSIGLSAVSVFTLLLLISQALEVYPVNVLAICLIAWRLARLSPSATSISLDRPQLPQTA